MNNYQEDLGRIARLKLENGKVAEDFLPQTFKELQELVEKETMEKPRGIVYSKKENKFIGVCRKCHTLVNQSMRYCFNCGQHLDWIEENESLVDGDEDE